ncbi:MAG: XRE family transcriptional regulator [Candidatus Cloacimonetes bacterium]|nr:XRE family transcriptional regulator [Candidatus Cloacimonadota bacterium]
MYERYLQLLEESNMKNADVARATKIHPSTFTDWKKGKSSPKIDKLQSIAELFNVNIDWLTGASESKERPKDIEDWNERLGILPISKQRLPLLGEIACGEPIFANEERESYIEAGTNIQADFCLKAKGDSMINARIHDGDVIFIRKWLQMVILVQSSLMNLQH